MMLRKTIAVLGIAAALVLAGAGGAGADTYPVDITCVAASATLSPGQSTDVDCRGDSVPAGATGIFSVSGPGIGEGALASSIPVGTTQITKTASGDGVLSVRFTAPDVTESATYTISMSDTAGTFAATTSVTVNGTGGDDGNGASSTGSGGELSSTGGAISPALLWIGLGVLAVGATVVTTALVRRRSRSDDGQS